MKYQWRPMPGNVLKETVERYNSFVDAGKDADFNKPKPLYKIQTPPFYAAWATPCVHDCYVGLRTNTNAQVLGPERQRDPWPLRRRRFSWRVQHARYRQSNRLRPHRRHACS